MPNYEKQSLFQVCSDYHMGLGSSSDNPLNCYVSSLLKSLRDGLDTCSHYIFIRSAQ